VNRRDLVAGCCTLFAAGWLPTLSAHTLYNQWQVYRKKHLLIGSHREDDLAKQIAAILDENLPKSRARVARAPTAGRIASLMATAQMDVAVVNSGQADDLAKGNGIFKPYGRIDLKTVFVISEYALIARAEMPNRHSWLIAHALANSSFDTSYSIDPPLPWHPGAADFYKGQPLEN